MSLQPDALNTFRGCAALGAARFRYGATVLVYAVLVCLQAAPLGAVLSRAACEVASSSDAQATPCDETALAEMTSDRARRRSPCQSFALCALATPGASAQGEGGLCRACMGRAANHNGRGVHLRR